MGRSNRDCQAIGELIDPWIDGDLSAEEAQIVAEHVKRCARCASDVRQATRLASELRSLSSYAAPAWMSPAAVARAGMADFESRRGERIHKRGAGSRRGAMAAMLVAVAAAGAFVLALRDHGGNGRQATNVTQAEVEEAARELHVAFAYVGRYSRRAGNIVSKDVINDRVIPAIGRAVGDRRPLSHAVPIETNHRGRRSNPGKEPQ